MAQVKLTKAQVEQVRLAVCDGPEAWLLKLWRFIVPDFDSRDSVDPRDWQIPRAQANEVMQDLGPDRSQWLMLWLNNGPGTY